VEEEEERPLFSGEEGFLAAIHIPLAGGGKQAHALHEPARTRVLGAPEVDGKKEAIIILIYAENIPS